MKFGHEKIRKAYKPSTPFKTVEGIGTDPFRRLSPCAVWVLLRFYEKFSGFNRADLSLTYREVRGRMSGLLFSRSIWELVGFGFLDILRFGRLQRNCSLYALSNRWRGLCDSQKCERITAVLGEIEKLQREKGSSEKRQRVFELRHQLFRTERP